MRTSVSVTRPGCASTAVKRPQPPRPDGEAGTHHRCDPCRDVYDRRVELRRLLSDTDGLTYTVGAPDTKCSHCGAYIGTEFHYAYPVPESVYMGCMVCHRCAQDARFEIAPAASVVRVDLRPVDSGRREVFLAVMVPAGVPALFALGASFVSWAWRTTESRVQGGVMYRAEDKHLTVYIDGIDRDATSVRFVALIAANLAKFTTAINVTKGWGRSVRDALCDMGPDGRASGTSTTHDSTRRVRVVRVRAARCATCIYRRDSPLNPPALAS